MCSSARRVVGQGCRRGECLAPQVRGWKRCVTTLYALTISEPAPVTSCVAPYGSPARGDRLEFV